MSSKGVSQELNLNAPIPASTKVKKGVLPNGLTYYIYNTDVTKNAASYYIIQNVGSILENDDQQGLAHFLEHMAFNGTENFEGKGVLNTLQKHGAVFGKDINAYTSFDETVYNMNNIPTTPELIDTCLLVLHDWSNYLLLTDEEIDAERGVIKEEWRSRRTGPMRILEQSLNTRFNHSKYVNRLPIGLMDIVENFEYKALRDFYHDWYRTDLQAIAVIGDVDVAQIEAKIKEKFSAIPKVDNPKERFIVDIPDNEEMLFSLAMDEEVTTSGINFSIRHPKKITDRNVSDLKTSIISSMITGMLSSRMNEILQNPETPLLGASVSYGKNSRSSNVFSLWVSPKPNKQYEAFKIGVKELNRAVKHGFTQAEIDRTISNYTNYYENEITGQDDKSHGSIAEGIKGNYLENITIPDLEERFQIIKSIFEQLTAEEVHDRLKELYSDKNRYIIVTGVKGNQNLSEEDAASMIESIENDNSIKPYVDEFAGKTLMSGIAIKPGNIVKETETNEIGATTFVLSNGAKVHFKFSKKNKNDVSLKALSYGGVSLLNEDEIPSVRILSDLVGKSGLGDYSAVELNKILAGKTAFTSVSVGQLSESISGSSVTKDVETLLQMTFLRFVKPRFDEEAYKVQRGNINNYLLKRSKDVDEKMNDSLTVALYGKADPNHRLFNSDLVKEFSFEKVKEIYSDRFNDPADFEFFIVGDVKEAQLKPLLEKYIASIPSQNTQENWKDKSSSWVNKEIDKKFNLKMEVPKGKVFIGYKSDFEFSLKNEILAKAIGDVLQLRFTQTLREEEGGTYGASTRSNLYKRPKSEAELMVTFNCNPDKVETLVEIVHREIHKLAQGDVLPVDLEKTMNNYLKEREQEKGYNRYEMDLLIDFFREGYNRNDPNNFENIVKNITVNDIQEFVKKLLDNSSSFEIIFKPLK
ncbi:M16 family metallopeptidase [Pseudotamlana haliotis]|nr:M16 family metallopeptidase [Tamlana haliotis]